MSNTTHAEVLVPGGVCLNVGCIPSKALLHVAQFIHEAEAMVSGRRRMETARLEPVG